MAWCDAAARRAAGRHFCAVQAAQSGLQRYRKRLPAPNNYAYTYPQKPSPQAYLAPPGARGSYGPVADRSAARGTSRLLELEQRAGA